MMRICSKCRIEKSFDNFQKDKTRAYGISYICRECSSKKNIKYYNENKDSCRQYGIDYYWKDPEARKEQKQKSYWSNPEHYRAQDREYYAKNPVKRRAKTNKYRKLNPLKVAEYGKKSRVTRQKCCPSWLSAIDWAQIEAFYEIAKARTTQTGIKYHVDHIHPIIGRGFNGLHVPWNLQVISAKENMAKYNRLPDSDAHLGWSA